MANPPLHRRPALLAVAPLAALALAACGHNVASDFPLSDGFLPLEATSDAALPPSGTVADPFPEGLGLVVAAGGAGYHASHARGYLHAPLAKVYQALHDPTASYVHNSGGGTRTDGPPILGEEPFPVSFRVRYLNSTLIGDVKFDLTYRAGPLEGTESDLVRVGERYQKTWGTTHISIMSGSLVAYEVAAGVTEVEMIAWLNADTQGQADCDGTVRDLFGDLQAVVAALP